MVRQSVTVSTTLRRRGLTEEAATAAVDQACRRLRLPTIRAVVEDAATAARKDQLSYYGFLAELLLSECDDRDRRSVVRRIKGAGFPREKWLADFDFDANPNINPATIKINLSLLAYLANDLNPYPKLQYSVKRCMYWIIQVIDDIMMQDIISLLKSRITSGELTDVNTGLLMFTFIVTALPQDLVVINVVELLARILKVYSKPDIRIRLNASKLLDEVVTQYPEIMFNETVYKQWLPLVIKSLDSDTSVAKISIQILTKTITYPENTHAVGLCEELVIKLIDQLLTQSEKESSHEYCLQICDCLHGCFKILLRQKDSFINDYFQFIFKSLEDCLNSYISCEDQQDCLTVSI